jgi:hypothetical protein
MRSRERKRVTRTRDKGGGQPRGGARIGDHPQ